MANLLDKIRSWLPAGAERRSIVGGESWVVNPTLAGVIVNDDTAPTYAAVYAAINVLSSDTSSVPLNVYRRGPDGGREIDYEHPVQDIVCTSPNEELTSEGMRQAMMWHLLTVGNAYGEIEREPETLRPVAIHLLDPNKVRIKRTADETLYYEVGDVRFLPRDIIHVAAVGRDGLIGRSPITQCREEIGLGMSVVKFGAARFGNGIQESGVISIPETLDEVESKAFRDNINRVHQGPYNAHKFLLLQGGGTFTRTSISAEDSQFLGTRKFNLEEVCRIFRIPPTKLMNFDKASFSNIEETNLDYYLSSLLPWLRRIEGEFNRRLFTRAERRVLKIEHDETYTLRGRIADQANVDKIYRDMGVLSTDEIRARRGWGKVKGGEIRFVPLNMAPLEQAAAMAALKPPAPTPTDKPEGAPVGSAEGLPVDDVQAAALNGAQIASMLSIVQQVAIGGLPVAAAKGLIAASFPTLDEAQIDKIFESLEGFQAAPEPGQAPDDPRPDEGRAATLDAIRDVFLDVARRMVRREAKAVRNIARKAAFDGIVEGLERFYGDEAATLEAAYAPSLRALAVASGRPDLDPAELARSLVARSRAELLPCVEGPSTSDALAALADRWEAEKADSILAGLAP